MTTNHNAGLAWAGRALASELKDATPQDIRDRAEALWSICEQQELPIDALVTWIHARAPGKQWSGPEFRAWCDKLHELEAEIAREKGVAGICIHCGDALPTREDARMHTCHPEEEPA